MNVLRVSWQELLLDSLEAVGIAGLADQTTDAVVQDAPELYAGDLRRLARRSVEANLTLLVDLVRGELELDAVEPPAQAVAFARELARRNVPMTELARVYRIGQHVMWRFGCSELRARIADAAQAAAAIERYTDATFVTGDVLMSRALERYADERDRWVRSADAIRRSTVQALLAGQPVDIATASARVRYDLARRHRAFVVWSEEPAGLEGTAATVGGTGALIVSLGEGLLAGWAAAEVVTEEAEGPGQVAFGTAQAGHDGFRASHREAMEARRVAMLAGRPGNIDYRDIALVALLTADLDQARRFAARELGGLAEPEAGRLAETLLEVLAHQGSPRHAAQALGVHENTVAKRLRAAEARLGRSAHERSAETLAALLILRILRGNAHAAAESGILPR